jgi:signal transduction histidine kinase
LSRRAVSPIVRLARSVSDINPGATDLPQFDFTTSVDRADGEILILAQALDQLADRINRFVERERNFSREASHELRSPLTVIRIACDTLLSDDDLPETSKTSIDRIRRAAHDMEELTQVLLLLAREDEGGLERESISVNEVIRQEVSKCELIYAPKNINIWFVEEGELTLDASPRVVAILLGNVIRNACAYTDKGSVSVTIGDGVVTIEDSGVGISEVELKAVFERYYRVPNSRESGHGIGLSLVKSLTERFDWPLTIESEPGFGTRVTVSFPASTFRPAAAGRAPVSAG